MPLFVLLGPVIATGARWILAGVAAGAGAELKDVIEKRAVAYFTEKGEEFLTAAAEKMGLELSADGHLTDESLTAAVNKLLEGTGIVIDSILDREALRRGLERLAAERLAADVGAPGVTSLAGVRVALQQWAAVEVVKQYDAESGAIFDGAKPSEFIARVIASPKVEGWNSPTDMSAKGVANRERQAKYRQSHKRTWIEK